MNPKYKVNFPRVIHETIDGETVIIDFELGNYFSVRDCGVYVWESLVRGLSVERLLVMMNERYSAHQDEIRQSLDDFLKSLAEEGLIVPSDDLDHQTFPPDETPEQKLSFRKPLLEKFTDMQELLLLDPIHEVDETGWPRQKT